MHVNDPHRITSLEALQALYGTPGAASIAKEVDYVHPDYRAFIEASPFAVLATSGPTGLDASPRGDPRGFVTVQDSRTLLLPDRRGNNRVDSLSNIVADPRVALIFLVPGVDETLRVNGRASISVDPALLERFAMDGKPPRSVLVIRVEAVYFQCARALVRSQLWNSQRHADRAGLPSPGQILKNLSGGMFDGAAYDQALPARVQNTLY